jgi:uncharacterized protein with GYD domain
MEGSNMPIFISRGCYTADALRGMVAAPEDREPSIAKVFEKLGGKLLCYYVTLGEFDWLLIADFPTKRWRRRPFWSQWRGAASPTCKPL